MTTPIDGRQLIRELQPRQAITSAALDTALGIEQQQYPSLFEDVAFFRFAKGIEIRHTTPEYRTRETDQAAPAGDYRWGSTGDNFVMGRSQAANFGNVLGSATDFDFLEYNRSNTYLGLFAPESNSWYIYLLAGTAATPGTNASMQVNSHATNPNLALRTGNVGGGSLVTRLSITGGAGTPDIDVTTATLDMNGNNIKSVGSLKGPGSTNLRIDAYLAPTDAVAYRTTLNVIDPATDTEYTVAQAVPKAATPLFTFIGSDYVPTVSELDADHYCIGYTKATNTAILYHNEGGVIVSVVLGLMA